VCDVAYNLPLIYIELEHNSGMQQVIIATASERLVGASPCAR